MTNLEAFEAWRAAAGRWAQWIKTPLFILASRAVSPRISSGHGGSWPPAGNTMLIVDLPGVQSVELGCTLAAQGYCPVPAFNTTPGEHETVPTKELTATLLGAATLLKPRADGTPVWLLDSQRQLMTRTLAPSDYDNRWFVFMSDFPSANVLEREGIHELLVITKGPVANDLRDALVGHSRLNPVWLDLETGTREPLEAPRSKRARGLRTAGRWLRRRADGSFGGPMTHG